MCTICHIFQGKMSGMISQVVKVTMTASMNAHCVILGQLSFRQHSGVVLCLTLKLMKDTEEKLFLLLLFIID